MSEAQATFLCMINKEEGANGTSLRGQKKARDWKVHLKDQYAIVDWDKG